MSDRAFKSSFELIAYPNTTNKPSDDNNNMRTTENDDIMTKARRATAPCMVLDHLLPAATNRRAIQDPQVGIEACILPSGVTRPGGGTDFPAGPARPVLPTDKCSAACTGFSAYTQPPSRVYCEEHMPRPPAVVGACKPFADLVNSSTIHSTQGTGTQGKTRGQDPGVQFSPPCEEEHAVRFGFSPPCEEEHAVRFGKRDFSHPRERRNAGKFSSENYGESSNPSDCDDNDDMFPEDGCTYSLDNSGTSTAAASVNSEQFTAAAIEPPLPSPMWSKRSRRKTTSLGRSRSDYVAPLGLCKTEKCDCTAPLGQRLTEKSMTLRHDEVPLDLLCPRSKAALGRLSPKK